MPKQRIQKILAAAGYGSRRSCEELVLDGRVCVNDVRIHSIPALADPQTDKITVDGEQVAREKLVYYMLNKPAGIFCTNNDPSGRKRAIDLLTGVRERVFPVGRLDAESMGLLIFTNDGPLTQKLTHPRFGVLKTYRVEVAGHTSANVLEKLRSGIWLSEGKTAPARIDIVHSNNSRTILEITLRESRNREIRRMLAKMGHNVRRLVRIKMGRLSIAKLPFGSYRPLTQEEVKQLRALAEGAPTNEPQTWKSAPRARPRKPSRAGSTTGTAATEPRRPARRMIKLDRSRGK